MPGLILVTGAAGIIGFPLGRRPLDEGAEEGGLPPCSDVAPSKARPAGRRGYVAMRADPADGAALDLVSGA